MTASLVDGDDNNLDTQLTSVLASTPSVSVTFEAWLTANGAQKLVTATSNTQSVTADGVISGDP